MVVEISKTKNNLYDVRLEQYKCGKLCENAEDIKNYIYKQMSNYTEDKIDIFIDKNINDNEYKEIIKVYKGEKA